MATDYGDWLQAMQEGGYQPGSTWGMVSTFDPAVLAKYGFGTIKDGQSLEDYASQGVASGLGYELGGKTKGGTQLYLTKNGQRTGDETVLQDTPTNWYETALPLAFAAATGGALGLYDLPGLMSSMGLGEAAAAGVGDTVAGLGASQVGALGGAAGAGEGALATLGATMPESIATLGSTLGADYGTGALLSSIGAGGMAGSGALAGLGATMPESIGTLAAQLGSDYGTEALLSSLGSGAASSAPYVMSSADKAAMLGAEGYGTGMSGLQTGAYDALLNGTGSSTLAGLGSTLANGASTISSLVGGGSNLAALIGGVAGASSGGGTTTDTKTSKLDPVMQQYLYGSGYGDTNSLLGAAQNWYKNNSTGMNATMQQGLDMQKSALTDPAYSQAYTQMRNLGTGLLGNTIAGNPFTSGQASMPTSGLLATPTDTAQLIKIGKGLLPNSI